MTSTTRSTKGRPAQKKAGAGGANAAPLAPKGRPTFETGILLGPTGCGKTSTSHEMAEQYLAQGGRVWAIDPSRAWRTTKGVQPIWPGLRRLDEVLGGDDPDTGAIVGLAAQPPGLVIFDDADRYMRRPSQVRDDWMVSFRHYRKDLLIISRRPAGIPKDAFANASFICLYPGSLTDPHARNYLTEAFAQDAKQIMKAVPMEPYHYLYCRREGAEWIVEAKQVRERPVTTASDKSKQK